MDGFGALDLAQIFREPARGCTFITLPYNSLASSLESMGIPPKPPAEICFSTWFPPLSPCLVASTGTQSQKRLKTSYLPAFTTWPQLDEIDASLASSSSALLSSLW